MTLIDLQERVMVMDLGELGESVKGLVLSAISSAHSIGYADGMDAANRIQTQVNEMFSKKLSKVSNYE